MNRPNDKVPELIPASAHLRAEAGVQADADWRAGLETIAALYREREDAFKRWEDAERRWQEAILSIKFKPPTMGRPSHFDSVLRDALELQAKGELPLNFEAACTLLHDRDVERCGGNVNAALDTKTIKKRLRQANMGAAALKSRPSSVD